MIKYTTPPVSDFQKQIVDELYNKYGTEMWTIVPITNKDYLEDSRPRNIHKDVAAFVVDALRKHSAHVRTMVEELRVEKESLMISEQELKSYPCAKAQTIGWNLSVNLFNAKVNELLKQL